MGCKLKPQVEAGGEGTLQCLCHGSRFDRRGGRVAGLAPSPLPQITLRVENGRVYALGTRETV
jgi:Rieske Fe-S protein